MATDNPKISAYVPQNVFDKFKQYQKEHKFSMSQAATVIFAQSLQVEYSIEKITDKTLIGIITLERIEDIEKKLKELSEEISSLNFSLLNELLEKINVLEKQVKELALVKDSLEKLPLKIKNEDTQESKLPLVLLSELPQLDKNVLARRFSLKNPQSINNMNNKPEFANWTSSKDPDGITWRKILSGNKINYIPVEDTPSELLDKLRDWLDCSKGVS